MIPDETYLKMILALPGDFFEKVEPAFGNLYWVETYQGWREGYSRKTYAVCSVVLDTGTYYLSLQDRKNFYEVIGSWEFEYSKRDKVIHWRKWSIPSQEQLQKMLIDFENKDTKYKHSNYFTISERFIAVVIEGDLVADMELKTLKEMWLEFVVYLMYDMVWNGVSWEKEE